MNLYNFAPVIPHDEGTDPGIFESRFMSGTKCIIDWRHDRERKFYKPVHQVITEMFEGPPSTSPRDSVYFSPVRGPHLEESDRGEAFSIRIWCKHTRYFNIENVRADPCSYIISYLSRPGGGLPFTQRRIHFAGRGILPPMMLDLHEWPRTGPVTPRAERQAGAVPPGGTH